MTKFEVFRNIADAKGVAISFNKPRTMRRIVEKSSTTKNFISVLMAFLAGLERFIGAWWRNLRDLFQRRLAPRASVAVAAERYRGTVSACRSTQRRRSAREVVEEVGVG